MKLIRNHTELKLPASTCALGMFDGVHLGHQMVLENAIRQGRILGVPSVVFSFADHPQKLLSQTPTQLLSSLDERLEQFEQLGFDYALILDFNDWLKNLSPEDFIQTILVDTLGVKHLTVGYDHRFGKNRAGDGEMLTQKGKELGFEVNIIDPVKVTDPASLGQIVSSTVIRKLLSFGDIQQANMLLGRSYILSGKVIKGFQRGRQIGFPTANLEIPQGRITPAIGTYGGFAKIGHKRWPALCNIGHSPTFETADNGVPLPRVEVYLLDYEGPEFYGETLRFEFTTHLREERKFSSVEALVQQIQTDCETYRSSLSH